MLQFVATHHARERARERFRWHPRTLCRMLERIFYFGIPPERCAGGLRAYLTAITDESAGGRVVLYGEQIFVFGRAEEAATAALLTVYPLPAAYRARAHRARLRAIAHN